MTQPIDDQHLATGVPPCNAATMAQICRALANSTRVTIVAAVARGETSPSQLARAHNCTVAAMSHHFRTLERERILCLAATRPVRGTVEHLYTLTAEGEVVAQLLPSIASAAERLHDLDQDLLALSRRIGLR
jgi:DNA-binding transcriptional ArsR family regulator